MDAMLLTHARQYVGPGAVPVLLREQPRLVCHDAGFVDPDVARNLKSRMRAPWRCAGKHLMLLPKS
jgi:hypothetical protein